MTLRELADSVDAGREGSLMDARELADMLNRMCARGSMPGAIYNASTALRSQADRIDALEAQAVTQAMQVRDLMAENARLAERRGAIKAAWARIVGYRGWLSRGYSHDCECPLFPFTDRDWIGEDYSPPKDKSCACGGDDFRRLMEE